MLPTLDLQLVTDLSSFSLPFLSPAKYCPSPGPPCSSSFSSIKKATNLFCSCKPVGVARTFLLVPEVISFHPSFSPEVLLTLIVQGRQRHLPCYRWGPRLFKLLRLRDPVCLPFMFPDVPPAHCLLNSSSCQHSSGRTQGYFSWPQTKVTGNPWNLGLGGLH